MDRIRRRMPSPAIVIAVIALVAAVAGTAIAGPPFQAEKSASSAKALKKAKKALKKARQNEAAIKALQRKPGPQGPPGQPGTPGAPGDPAAVTATTTLDATGGTESEILLTLGNVDLLAACVAGSPMAVQINTVVQVEGPVLVVGEFVTALAPFSVDFLLREQEDASGEDDGEVASFTILDGNQSHSGIASIAMDESEDICRFVVHATG